MTPALLAFLYGFAAAFLLVRLRRGSRPGGAELRWLIRIGWVTVGLSFALAAALILWAARTA